MTISRRGFLGDSAMLALLSGLMEAGTNGFAQAQTDSPESAPHDALGYWSTFFDDATSERGSRGKSGLAAPARDTTYLHSPEEGQPLQFANNIPAKDLMSYNGDVAVNLHISQYRPGTGDQNLQASQLRIDTVQTKPYMNLLTPLAWSAIASLTPDKMTGKMPSLDQLGFKSAAATTPVSQLILPQGMGKLAVNVSKAPPNSKFISVFKALMQGGEAVMPLLNLPAISLPAIKTFTEVFAYYEDRTLFLMNGNLTPVVATADAAKSADAPTDFVGLLNGYYIMVPELHKPELTASLPNLVVQRGYLVHKDAPDTQDLQTRMQNAVPGVTYATMRVNVSKSANPSCSAAKSGTASA